MTERENMLRTIRFERPDHIPMVFAINPACYEYYNHDDLFDLIDDHKLLFPNFKRPEGKIYTRICTGRKRVCALHRRFRLCLENNAERHHRYGRFPPAR